jgi:hypothetical protein
MKKILSLFSLTPENVGDMACSWGNQYESFNVIKSKNQYNSIISSNENVTFGHINDFREDYNDFDLVVIGGGCIINSSHENGIWRAINSSKNCMIRSVGVKDWDLANKLRDKLKNNFTIRHTVEGFIYESCPSLVEVEKYKVTQGINKKIEKTKELLFACHQNYKEEIKILQNKGFDVIVNDCNIDHAFEKISKAKKVVTSSYHFLLWADAFGCEVELFSKDESTDQNKLPIDSDMRKFINIPIKYNLIGIQKYIKY